MSINAVLILIITIYFQLMHCGICDVTLRTRISSLLQRLFWFLPSNRHVGVS